MNQSFQYFSWFFAALILPRSTLGVFERLPLSVLCYLRLISASGSEESSNSEIAALLEQLSCFERLFTRLETMQNLSLSQVCKIHAVVHNGDEKGRLRQTPVSLVPSGQPEKPIEFRPPGHEGLRRGMARLLCSFNSQDRNLHEAAKFLWDFVNIHPFSDGNGRVARLIAGSGLDAKERCIFNLFCAEVMFNYKHKFSEALSRYQCSGDYSELGEVCRKEITQTREKVDRLGQICDEFIMRLKEEDLDAGAAANFIEFPVQPAGNLLLSRAMSKFTSFSKLEDEGYLGRMEINGNDFIVAEGILDFLENLRPYKNVDSAAMFNAKA